MARIEINPHGSNDMDMHRLRFRYKAIKGLNYSDMCAAEVALINGALYKISKNILLVPSDIHLLKEALEEK